jgi:hypothetical protein
VPSANDVINMSASLDGVIANRISTSTVPKPHHERILSLLQAAQHESRPSTWIVLGSVIIETKSGKQTLSLFRTGEATSAFKWGGKYYRGSSDEAIIQAITAAKEGGP